MSADDLSEARAEAEAILKLDHTALTTLFFQSAMKRNLSRTVRHLDKLVASGGENRRLGKAALEKLGFAKDT
jgi:hypothetical protein